jgi:beta-phosphoglucomutase
MGKVEASRRQNKWLIQKRRIPDVFGGWMDQTDGVLSMLHFKRKNQPIALGSASKNARPILEKTGIRHYFDAIVDGSDVTNANRIKYS